MAEIKPVDSPHYWRVRLAESKDLRRALWDGTDAAWERMEAKHRAILAREIKDDDYVLDCGCGWGRLLGLMPESWVGPYLGIDVSPEMIGCVALHHSLRRPNQSAWVGDCRRMAFEDKTFDVAVCCMFRHMVRTHLGEDQWALMEREITRVAKRVIILEPDEVENG